MVIIGIDPGMTGAVATIWEDGAAAVFDMPTLESGTNKRRRLDASELSDELRTHRESQVHVFLEKAQAMSKEGAVGAFSYGEGFGTIQGILTALRIPFDLVRPQDWRVAMVGRGAPKDKSRERAMQIFPLLSDKLSRKKDHGRAEALLIAEWGRRLKS
jgi:crossover junction endodeoxyribonuclease RuvC